MAEEGHNIVGVDPDVFKRNVARIAKAQMAKDAADEAYRSARKAAKADGIVLGDLDQAMRLHDLGKDELIASIQRQTFYAKWLGSPIGAQLDMFSEGGVTEAPLIERAESLGHMAGLMGKGMEENPHDPTTVASQAWLKGWHDGHAMFEKANEPGIEPLGPEDTEEFDGEAEAPEEAEDDESVQPETDDGPKPFDPGS